MTKYIELQSFKFRIEMITLNKKLSNMAYDIEPTCGNGKICHLELPSRNIDESAAFYELIFGWKKRERDDGSVAFDDGVGQVSGTWRADRKLLKEPGTLVHIMFDNIEATMMLFVENCGQIVRQVGEDAPEITALFVDTTGNLPGLYQEPK
jgi:uncharacterized protein